MDTDENNSLVVENRHTTGIGVNWERTNGEAYENGVPSTPAASRLSAPLMSLPRESPSWVLSQNSMTEQL
jgi:hypothetical protein